jgi:hypothetical protein
MGLGEGHTELGVKAVVSDQWSADEMREVWKTEVKCCAERKTADRIVVRASLQPISNH